MQENKKRPSDGSGLALIIVIAIIIALTAISALVNGGLFKDNRNCEESYAYGQYHERCWDDQADLDDKYAKELEEYENQRRADEAEYWSDKYENEQYDY